MNIKIVDDLDSISAAKIALSNRLFICGWDLNPLLHRIVENRSKDSFVVILAYLDNSPIGVAVGREYYDAPEMSAQFFVRKKHRRNGFGRLLAESIKDRAKNLDFYAYTGGVEGCEEFFKSVEIEVKD